MTDFKLQIHQEELGQMVLGISIPGKPIRADLIFEVDGRASYALFSTPGEQMETSVHDAVKRMLQAQKAD